jgi:hypothetical protein
LLNAYDNDLTEVAHIRGAIAGDLHGAFKEWEVQADALTRCDKYLYSLSVNPDPRHGTLSRDQYLDYIGRAEDALGLSAQPRAIVFHVKEGREHCHVVWSRIDAEHGRAVHLAFDHEKLMRVTREFARDHGIDLPKGYEKSRQVGQESLYERAQLRETGLSKADHMRNVTEAWQQSDDAKAFVRALAERGYMLATGKRPYLVVDLYGNVNALPKLIDDKAVRTADVREFLERDYPAESLPSVEEAEKLVAAHRQELEQSAATERNADQLAILKQSQQERRAPIERERAQMKSRHLRALQAKEQEHRAERDALRRNYRETVKAVREARIRDRPTGLAAFLGRVTGVDLIRKALHRNQDMRRLRAYQASSHALKSRQEKERNALTLRQEIQRGEVERLGAALSRVERREIASYMRDRQTNQRIRNRGGDARMPSLEHMLGLEDTAEAKRDIDLLAAFDAAKARGPQEAPDLLAAFSRAAEDRESEEDDSGDETESALDRPRSPNTVPRDGLDKGRDRER